MKLTSDVNDLLQPLQCKLAPDTKNRKQMKKESNIFDQNMPITGIMTPSIDVYSLMW